MWNIIFYEKGDGTTPVQEFLDKPNREIETANNYLEDYQRRNPL